MIATRCAVGEILSDDVDATGEVRHLIVTDHGGTWLVDYGHLFEPEPIKRCYIGVAEWKFSSFALNENGTLQPTHIYSAPSDKHGFLSLYGIYVKGALRAYVAEDNHRKAKSSATKHLGVVYTDVRVKIEEGVVASCKAFYEIDQ